MGWCLLSTAFVCAEYPGLGDKGQGRVRVGL